MPTSNQLDRLPANLSLEEILARLHVHCKPLASECVKTSEALGRMLAEDIISVIDLPKQNLSVMDGYAVDSASYLAKEQLKITGMHSTAASKTSTYYVHTGDAINDGFNAVIPHEKVTIKEGILSCQETIAAGANIRAKGEDFKPGDLVCRQGTAVTPGIIGVMTALGFSTVPVIKKPRVAVLSINPNIAPLGEEALGAIIDSIGPMLKGLIEMDGGWVTGVFCASSFSTQNSAAILKEALQDVDVLLTIGGTYTGGMNDIARLCQQNGGEVLFNGAAIKPGGHSCAGLVGGKLVIGLSGHAAACAVGYQLICQPVLRAMAGRSFYPKIVVAECICEDVIKLRGRTFLRGDAFLTQNGWEVIILPGQKSTMRRSLMDCNSLLDVGVNERVISTGSRVKVILQGYGNITWRET